MRISDWSSDVCSSDLRRHRRRAEEQRKQRDAGGDLHIVAEMDDMAAGDMAELVRYDALHLVGGLGGGDQAGKNIDNLAAGDDGVDVVAVEQVDLDVVGLKSGGLLRSEEQTSELQSLMRISYAVFCLKKKKENSYI